MIVYGVTAEVSISKLFMAGVLPGLLLASMFSGYLIVWSLMNPGKIPPREQYTFMQKTLRVAPPDSGGRLITAVLGSIYTGIATATEAAAVGVMGSFVLSAVQRSLSWATFKDSLMGATRLYCMIALILAGASFLTLSMGYIGLPRHLAEYVSSLGLSPFMLILVLSAFYIVLGCFLDGISMVVLTMGVILPTVQSAGIDLLWFGIFIVHRGRGRPDHAAGGLQPVRAAGHDQERNHLHCPRHLALLHPHGRNGAAAVVHAPDRDLAAAADGAIVPATGALLLARIRRSSSSKDQLFKPVA
jgi:tripartite ATP-independent transporter DctM subunit